MDAEEKIIIYAIHIRHYSNAAFISMSLLDFNKRRFGVGIPDIGLELVGGLIVTRVHLVLNAVFK